MKTLPKYKGLHVPLKYNKKLKTAADYCKSREWNSNINECENIPGCGTCLFRYHSDCNKKSFNQWIKTNEMKKTVTLQTENILKAHEEGCEDVKKVLETLHPELFKEEIHPLFEGNVEWQKEARGLITEVIRGCISKYDMKDKIKGDTNNDKVDNIIEAIYKLTK